MSARARFVRAPIALLLVLHCIACGEGDSNGPATNGSGASAGSGAASGAPAGGMGGSAMGGQAAGTTSGGASIGGDQASSGRGGTSGTSSTAGSGGAGASAGGTGGAGGAGDPSQALETGNTYCEKMDAEDCSSLTTLEQCKAALSYYEDKSQACLDATRAYWLCALAAADVCAADAACMNEGEDANDLCFPPQR
jgi:hypothetical protein